jgi:hypothetical protein
MTVECGQKVDGPKPRVFGVKYTGKNKIGDLEWMMAHPDFKNAIFLYCDSDDVFFSSDLYGLRQYKRRAFPIPVCSETNGCFSGLSIYNKLMINMAFNHLHDFIKDNSDIDTVFYSFETGDIRVLHEHPFVCPSVISYIMTKIREISDKPVQWLKTRSELTSNS